MKVFGKDIGKRASEEDDITVNNTPNLNVDDLRYSDGLSVEQIREVEGIILRSRPNGLSELKVVDGEEFLSKDFVYGKFKGSKIKFTKGSTNRDIYMVVNLRNAYETHLCQYERLIDGRERLTIYYHVSAKYTFTWDYKTRENTVSKSLVNVNYGEICGTYDRYDIYDNDHNIGDSDRVMAIKDRNRYSIYDHKMPMAEWY